MTDDELRALKPQQHHQHHQHQHQSFSSRKIHESSLPLQPQQQQQLQQQLQHATLDWSRSAAAETFSRYDLPSPQSSFSMRDPVPSTIAATAKPRAQRGFVDLDTSLPAAINEFSRIAPVLPTTQGLIPLRTASLPASSASAPNSAFSTPRTAVPKTPQLPHIVHQPPSASSTPRPVPSTLKYTPPIATPSQNTDRPDSRASVSSSVSSSTPDYSIHSQPNPPNLHLSFLPLAKNFLGNGRYAKVYLANYSLSETTTTTPTTSTGGTESSSSVSSKAIVPVRKQSDSIPCAVKQMNANHECFQLAVKEAQVLRMLSGHPNIIQLIGTTSEEANMSPTAADDDEAAAAADDDFDFTKKRDSGASAASFEKYRRRRSSRNSRLARNGGGGRKSRNSTHKGGGGADDDDENADFMFWSDEEQEEEGIPRMMIVLELATQGTMMDYINSVLSEGVGQDIWMKWAKQLANAIDYVHSFGYVHHDVKPHNCLLTDGLNVKLGDFGNALQVHGFRHVSTTTTPHLQPGSSTTQDNFIRMSSSPPMLPAPLTHQPSSSTNLSDSILPPSLNTSSLRTSNITNPNTTNHEVITSPISFVDRFKSEISDALSVRTSRTGSLTDGLGRGTQAYMAPEIFQGGAKEYSFPVDIYAIGVTLFVAATGVAPFSGGGGGVSSVYMMMGIKRGFFASGMQLGFGVYGPDVSLADEDGDEGAATTKKKKRNGGNGIEMRRSLCQDGSGGGGLKGNRWLQPGEKGVNGGEGVVRFANGDPLDTEAVRIMCACLELDGSVRPTGRELVVWLNTLGN